MNMRVARLTVLIGALCLVAACAGPNPVLDVPVLVSDVSGFWGGLWHGLILPFAFIGSIITDNISIYATQNTGGWYDFGFLIGVSLLGVILNN